MGVHADDIKWGWRYPFPYRPFFLNGFVLEGNSSTAPLPYLNVAARARRLQYSRGTRGVKWEELTDFHPFPRRLYNATDHTAEVFKRVGITLG